MKPHLHANASAGLYGGKPEDYQAIHDFIDSSKAHLADVRHRAIFHHSFGIFICEKVFGTTITNSDGRQVSVRDIAEEHILQDCGRIPTVQDYLRNMRIQPWMASSMSRHLSVRKAKFKRRLEN